MLPPPIVAFGFANLAMLGWLGAAAAPILIHLWMRQTHRETAWAAIRFLQAALERQARRLRLQHWILLAVRTLLLICVALAAAKPLLDSGLLGGGAATHRVVVLDASLSMSAVDADGETALARAKRMASSLVDAARAGDTHSVVVMGTDAGTPIGRPTSDANAARRAIDAVAPSQGVADLAAALTSARRLIDAANETTSGRRHEVVFFTDMAPNTWAKLEGGEVTTAVGETYEALATIAEVSAFDVGGSTLPSVAVTSLVLSDGLPTLAAPVEVRGEVRQFAGKPGERLVELLVDGAPVAERRLNLTSGQPTPFNFYHGFDTPGPRAISVRLAEIADAPDRLAADNERYLAVNLRQRVKVLCVAGSPGAADYLADALDPTGNGVFEPVVVADADLPTIRLPDYACVFLSNVRELSDAEAGRLRRYAEAGGGVAWFLGDRVNANRYNETLAPTVIEPMAESVPRVGESVRFVSTAAQPQASEKSPLADPSEAAATLLPGRLSPSIAVPSYRVDPLEYAHPIVRPFRGQERAGLLTTPVARHFPLAVSKTASVALALANGDPLLVTAEFGRGRVAVLTTAATLGSVDPATGEAWTALPAWPSFLPIVRELVRYLAHDGGSGSALLVGDTLDGQADAASSAVIAIAPPDGGAEAVRITPDSDGAWSYLSTKRAGVYRFGPQDEPPTAAAAVNIDPGESDPATVATDRLPASFKVRRTAGETNADSVAGATPTPIHRWLLYGALALALVEPALACLFGRGSG